MSKSVCIGVTFRAEDVELIEAICSRSGRSKPQVIRYIVRRYFEQMQDGLMLVDASLPAIDLLDFLLKEAP